MFTFWKARENGMYKHPLYVHGERQRIINILSVIFFLYDKDIVIDILNVLRNRKVNCSF